MACAAIALSSVAQAQGYDEGVAPTRAGPDAESGQFEAPTTWARPTPERQPDMPWQPQPSGQFACDTRDQLMDRQFWSYVAKIPVGSLARNGNRFVLNPLLAAAKTEGAEIDQLYVFMLALGQAGLTATFSELRLAMIGGQFVMGGVRYTIDEFVAGARDQQIQAILSGDYSGAFGDYNNIGANTAFITFLRRRYPQVTVDTLGQYIRTEQELTAAVGQWEAYLRDVLMETRKRPDQQRAISAMVVPRLSRI
jgi:hypothetical protein